MPGLAQSGNLIETSLLGFRRASPSASLLALLHCWLPASRWQWVCCGVRTPVSASSCVWRGIPLSLTCCPLRHPALPSPSLLHPCHSLKLAGDCWSFSELYSGKRYLLLLDCSGEGLPSIITVSPCMFCVLCSNTATEAPVCAPSKGSPNHRGAAAWGRGSIVQRVAGDRRVRNLRSLSFI